MMESVKPPGVEDCPSPQTQDSYQDVVASVVVGIVVVVVVVGGNVVLIDMAFINFRWRRRRMRAILRFRRCSGLSREFVEDPLLAPITLLWPLLTVVYCTLLLL